MATTRRTPGFSMSDASTTYHVFCWPEGNAGSYLGAAESIEEARALANSGEEGLPASLYGTARTAGHVNGISAPPSFGEDAEPIEWCGPDGYHAIMRED